MSPAPPSASAGAAARWLAGQRQGIAAPLRRATVYGLLGGAATLLQAVATAWIVHAVAIEGRALASLPLPIIALALALLLRALAFVRQQRVAAAAAESAVRDIRRELLDAFEQLGPARLENWHHAALASRTTESADAIGPYLAHYLPQSRLAVAVPLMIVTIVFLHDWLAATLLLLTAPLIPLFMALVGWGAESLSQRFERRRAQAAAVFADRIRALPSLRLFGAEARAKGDVRRFAERLRDDSLRVLRVAFVSSAVLEFFAAVAVAAVAIYVGMGLLGYITFGPADQLDLYRGLCVLLLAPEFFLPLRRLASHYHDRAAALGAARELLPLLQAARQDAAPDVRDTRALDAAAEDSARPGQAGHAQASRVSAPTGEALAVFLQDVDLCRHGRPVLRGFQLRVAPGECVALAGPSGCGKTSVLHLVAEHLRPDRGSISGGAPGGGGAVAWLSQSPFIAHGSIARNIGLGRPGARRQDIEEAARQCGVMAFAADLPQGLDTVIGRRGVGLSGGQAQRVALARAWLSQAPLLLLDEPTAGLDERATDALLDALATLYGQRTLILASHDPRVLAWVDRVVWLARPGDAPSEDGTSAAAPPVAAPEAQTGKGSGPDTGNALRRQASVPASAPAQGHALTKRASAGNVPGAASPACGRAQPAAAGASARPHSLDPEKRGQPASRPGRRRRLPEQLRRLGPWLGLLGPRRGTVVLGACLLLAATGSALGLLALSGWFITATGVTALLWQLGAQVRFDIFLPGAGIRFFALARTVARYFERLVQHDLALSALARLRARLFAGLCALPASALPGLRDDVLLDRITRDVDSLDNLLLRVISPTVVAPLLLLLLGIALAWLVSPLMALAPVALLAVLAPLCGRALLQGRKPGVARIVRRERLRRRIGEALAGLAELSAAGSLQAHRRVSQALDNRLARQQAITAARQARLEALAGLTVQTTAASCLLLGLWLHGQGAITAATAVLAGLAVLGTGELLGELPRAFHHLGGTLAASDRLHGLAPSVSTAAPGKDAANRATGSGPAWGRGPVDDRPASDAAAWLRGPAAAGAVPHRATEAVGGAGSDVPRLRLRRLAVYHDNALQPVLRDLSLDVAAGERIAITGASGSGKSSLVAAITRMARSHGELRLDGETAELLPAAAWRARIACLTQRSELLADTVAGNLRLVAPGADDDALWHALHLAALDTVVRELPQGLGTWVGEHGSLLSGGQARRLALARVLLRPAPLVILDEPFTGLDDATARTISRRLEDWLAGRSLIVFAHDTRVLPRVDRLLRLHTDERGTRLTPA